MIRGRTPLAVALAVALAGVLALAPARRASAQPAPEATRAGADAAEPRLDPAKLARLEREPGAYARGFGALAIGKGLRLNNPYRLETVLGEDAASLSTTATYLDASGAFTLGDPNGVQHGAALHVGAALEGVSQPYLSASYLFAYRADEPFLLYGRGGPVFLLAPDVNVGGELAGSFSWFFTSGLGVTSELVFDLFYGAATLETQYSVIPVLSLQLGLVADYEFLP